MDLVFPFFSSRMDLVKDRLSNPISLEDLHPGDHIYSWRSAYVYAHHGIYIGEEMVIHFGNNGREIGTGTIFDSFFSNSSNSRSGSSQPCKNCKDRMVINQGVVKSCIRCFLSGGDLYRFQYSTPPAIYKKFRGSCTMVPSDRPEQVIHRAEYLLQTGGFGSYNLVTKNCENFAIYCKTSLLGQSTQVRSIEAAAFSFNGSFLRRGLTSFTPIEGLQSFLYNRYNRDIDSRAKKVSLEELHSSLN